MKSILVDTGFLVALYDKREPLHGRCLSLHDETAGRLISCEAVIVETLHLLRKVHGAANAILESVHHGILEIPFTLADSASAVSELMIKYRDQPIDFTDACLIQMAGDLNIGDILTLDSDFNHYRWGRNKRFNLLVPLD